VLIAYANSGGYLGFAQMGWSILIFQSTEEAFLPIQGLWWIFGPVMLFTLILAFLASHWISGRIAKPLLALTNWIREVRHQEKLTYPQVGGTIEIQELEMAFRQVFLELERSREHVIQTAKLATVGEMSAIMAHEIRTPLGIISTSAQWLQREQGLSPEGREMSQFILEESARLRKLVTTLLECARPREPNMLQQNVHDLLKHCMELLNKQAGKKHLQIQLSLQASNAVILCDGELLTQAFLNLLLNAIQILKDGGIIQIHSSSLGQYLSIEIADNGPGISKEDQQRLFEPFFSKREGGIGLGLTVTRQIVLAHHGSLSATTSHLGGACFILNLPITQG
jgi:signal transduction histidine kinase